MTATDPAALLTAIDEALDHVATMRRLPDGSRPPTVLESELTRLLADCRAELARHTGIVVTYPAPAGWPPLSRDDDSVPDDDDAALAAAARKG